MKLLPFILILFLTSCCQKIVPVSTSTDTVTVIKVDTVYSDFLNIIPSDSSNAIEFNALTFCDSLQRGLVKLPYLVRSGKQVAGKRSIIGSVAIDSSGKGIIVCREAEYVDSLHKQMRINTEKETIIHNLEKFIAERKGLESWRAIALVEFLFIIIFGYMLIKRK